MSGFQRTMSPFTLGYEVCPKAQSQKLIHQVHGRAIYELERAESPGVEKPQADAIVSTLSHQRIMVCTADCVPILLWSTHDRAPFAAIHSGWRGTAAQIVTHTIEKLEVPVETLHAWVGPSIGPCCYEVGDELLDGFRSVGLNPDPYVEHKSSGRYFNLSGMIIETELCRLPASHLHTEQLRCTHCSSPRLPSYRRDGHTDPQLISWIKKSL